MIRKIVHIDEDKCNGCGICITACHEGAIELVDGKARLVADEYCDGLGDCLPECPTGAISIIERKSKPFDEEAVKRRIEERKKEESQDKAMPCGCPGSLSRQLRHDTTHDTTQECSCDSKPENTKASSHSKLSQWPVQLSLINTRAPYLQDAHILIAADCTAYAYGNFHEDFMTGKITLIGCPKLDDNNYYREKLGEILIDNDIKSVTVARMEVPCCGGIVGAVKGAMLDTGIIVPYSEIVISAQGEIISRGI